LIPRKGTELEVAQAAIEKKWRKREEVEDKVKVDGVADKVHEADVNGLDSTPVSLGSICFLEVGDVMSLTHHFCRNGNGQCDCW